MAYGQNAPSCDPLNNFWKPYCKHISGKALNVWHKSVNRGRKEGINTIRVCKTAYLPCSIIFGSTTSYNIRLGIWCYKVYVSKNFNLVSQAIARVQVVLPSVTFDNVHLSSTQLQKYQKTKHKTLINKHN